MFSFKMLKDCKMIALKELTLEGKTMDLQMQ